MPVIPMRKITLPRASAQQSKPSVESIPQRDSAATLPASGNGGAQFPVESVTPRAIVSPRKMAIAPKQISLTSPPKQTSQSSAKTSPEKVTPLSLSSEKLLANENETTLTSQPQQEVATTISRTIVPNSESITANPIPEKKPVIARRLSIRRQSSKKSETDLPSVALSSDNDSSIQKEETEKL